MNHTYFVTGGSRGIGAAIVEELTSNGHNVVFVYKNNEKMAKDVMNKTGALGIKCDVCNLDELREASKSGRIYFGVKSYDGLISSAGISYYNTVDRSSKEDISDVIETNLIGTINSVQAVVSEMISEKRGSIVLISSIWGSYGASGESIYSASKWGVIGLMKSLAIELGPSNIQVNGISPGLIMTDMSNSLDESILNGIKDETPLGVLGEAKDVANLSTFLLSEKSKFITGQNIIIDGGFTL